MTAATIRASATYRARRKAELARYREALELIASCESRHPQDTVAIARRALEARYNPEAMLARAALQGDKP